MVHKTVTVMVTSYKGTEKDIEGSERIMLYNVLSGTVHTGNESLQDGLGDMQTHKMTLASAYVLHCLSAMWL